MLEDITLVSSSLKSLFFKWEIFVDLSHYLTYQVNIGDGDAFSHLWIFFRAVSFSWMVLLFGWRAFLIVCTFFFPHICLSSYVRSPHFSRVLTELKLLVVLHCVSLGKFIHEFSWIQYLRSVHIVRKSGSKDRMITNLEKRYSLVRIDIKDPTEEVFHIWATILYFFPSSLLDSSRIAKFSCELCKLSFFFFRWQVGIQFLIG